MGKTFRKNSKIEEALQEAENRLRINRMPLKDLRKEMRKAQKYVGTIDWEELQDI